jgi:hypothetical protein
LRAPPRRIIFRAMSGTVTNAAAVSAGDEFCVTAHPYQRWTVVSVESGDGAVPNVVLRSSADPAVERVIALPVLQNPARFKRI